LSLERSEDKLAMLSPLAHGHPLSRRAISTTKNDVALWIVLGFIVSTIFYSLVIGSINIVLKNPLSTLKSLKLEEDRKDSVISDLRGQIQRSKESESGSKALVEENKRDIQNTTRDHLLELSRRDQKEEVLRNERDGSRKETRQKQLEYEEKAAEERDLRAEVEQLRPRIGTQQDKIREVERQLEDKDREFENEKARSADLAVKMAFITAEVMKLKTEDNDKEKRIAGYLARIGSLEATERDLKDSAANDAMILNREQTTHAETTLAITRQHACEIEKLVRDHRERTQRMQDLHARILRGEGRRVAALERTINEASERYRIADQERTQREAQAAEVLAEVERLRLRVGQQQDQIRTLQVQVEKTEQERNEAKNRNVDLAMKLTHATATASRRPDT
jgi:chromosome segregation ATPase